MRERVVARCKRRRQGRTRAIIQTEGEIFFFVLKPHNQIERDSFLSVDETKERDSFQSRTFHGFLFSFFGRRVGAASHQSARHARVKLDGKKNEAEMLRRHVVTHTT